MTVLKWDNEFYFLGKGTFVPTPGAEPAAINDRIFLANSEAEQILIDGKQGDICLREDLSLSFKLSNDDASIFANWDELISSGFDGYNDNDARAAIGDIFGADGKADKDINLDENDLANIECAKFNTSPGAVSDIEGTMCWDPTDKTLNIIPGIAGVKNQVGQENWILVNNRTGDKTNGQVVYIDGSQGNRVTIDLADASSHSIAKGTIAVLTQNIDDLQEGFATSFGLVRNINTNGLIEGAPVYLSDTVPGAFQQTPPDSPNDTVQIGIVARAHSDEGILFVSVVVNPILNEINDVKITNIQDLDLLQWDNAAGYWKNITGITAYGEFKIAENTNATVIRGTNQWQAITTNVVTGLLSVFSYDSGGIGTVSSIADVGGGIVSVTAGAAHGLAPDDIITINGTTNYNEIYKVLSTPSADVFTVTSAYVSDQSGFWQQGSTLTVLSGGEGVYKGTWASSGISEINAHVFDFTPVVNTVIATAATARRKFSVADFGSFSGTELVNLSVGDKITFAVRNITATNDVTIRTLDLNLHRM
jgi:hypothetical protein